MNRSARSIAARQRGRLASIAALATLLLAALALSAAWAVAQSPEEGTTQQPEPAQEEPASDGEPETPSQPSEGDEPSGPDEPSESEGSGDEDAEAPADERVVGADPAELPPHPAPREERIPDRYIVVFKRSVDDPEAETRKRESRDGFKSSGRYRRALKGFAAKLNERQLARLQADPAVDFITADRKVRSSPMLTLAPGEPVPPTGVRRIEAATTNAVRGASGAGVAVIDSGIDLNHPDLNAANGTNCISPGQPAADDDGHGTHVAGTIAARNNGFGVVGVAPGTRVHSVKVLDEEGSGTLAQVICGIDWVTANAAALNIKVANVSLGGSGPPIGTCATTTDAEHRAICNSIAAGVTYVVAAGNDGWDFDYAPSPDHPAAYPEVLTVTAVADSDGAGGGTGGAPACTSGEGDDRYASFSSFAATTAGSQHTIAGPGVCITSTAMGGGYTRMSGTSMATPHVAGAVALCIDEAGARGPCAGLSPAQIVARMRQDAAARTAARPAHGFAGDPTRPVSGRYFGHMTWSVALADDVAPTVTAVAPADGSRGVPSNAPVSVTFSEAMDQASTQAAFSLVRSSDNAPVAGSFSWNANTMTFTPAAPLAAGTTYTARLAATASDGAGNRLAAERSWSFSVVASGSVAPSAVSLEAGKLVAGSASRLGVDDNRYYQVYSTKASTRTTSWSASFSGVPRAPHSLTVAYAAKASATCSQVVALYRWTTGTWAAVDSRPIGASEARVDAPASGTLADFVSSTGQMRVRMSCTQTASRFYHYADLLRVLYTAQ